MRTHRESSTTVASPSPLFPWNWICDLPVISLLLVLPVSREQLLLQRARIFRVYWCFYSEWETLFLTQQGFWWECMFEWLSFVHSVLTEKGWEIHPCSWIRKKPMQDHAWQIPFKVLYGVKFLSDWTNNVLEALKYRQESWAFKCSNSFTHCILFYRKSPALILKALHGIKIAFSNISQWAFASDIQVVLRWKLMFLW